MPPQPQRLPRRTFLADMGMGFTGLVLGAMLHRDGVVRADEPGWSPPDGRPHLPPKAKNVIWLFMIGGTSQLESFSGSGPSTYLFQPVRGDRTPSARYADPITLLKPQITGVDGEQTTFFGQPLVQRLRAAEKAHYPCGSISP